MSKHAFLSASSSHRWLNCPPSAKLCAQYKDEISTFAKEGTDAHTLCEHKLKKALGMETEDPVENLSYYNMEMEDCAEHYCSFVLEQLEEAKRYCEEPLVLIEQRLDYSRWVKKGFGTGDCIIIAANHLHIIDYKHGMGVLVDAEQNPQMMCYALGALEMFDFLYDVKEVKMSIFQPRKSNISTYTMATEELLHWADTVLAPTAKLAYKGKGKYKAGDHCQFCKVKANCRKRAEHNLELARYEFAKPATLTPDEITEILPQVDGLISWANDIKDFALAQALSGTTYNGYKIVEGRSTRKYTDEKAVAQAVTKAGYDPYERKLLGITAMTSLLGKTKFNELLNPYIYRASGKPTLVPESDKRPAMNTAQEDFK